MLRYETYVIILAFLLHFSLPAEFRCIFERENTTRFNPIEAHEVLNGERLQMIADVVISTAAIAEFHVSLSCTRCIFIFLPETDGETVTKSLSDEEIQALQSAKVVFVYSAILPQVL
jgi:hypothetical protein